MQTYLVGRRNQGLPCDIELPEAEMSVSRRHLELSVTDDGRLYVVHLHPRNTTAVWRQGRWLTLTQDFVEPDERLRLGAYETSGRGLLALLPTAGSPGAPAVHAGAEMVWDAERGTYLRPRR